MENMISKEKAMEIASLGEKTITIDWCDSELIIKKTLSIQDTAMFVKEAVDGVYSDDGSYMPEAMDFTIRYLTLKYFTNVEMPDDITDVYNVVYSPTFMELFDIITGARENCEDWDLEWYGVIEDYHMTLLCAVDEKIAYRNDVQRNDVLKKIESLLAGVQAVTEIINSIVDGINPGDIQKMVDAIGENGIDEGKIVEAIVANKYTQPENTEPEE